MTDTFPRCTIRQLMPTPAHLDLVMVPIAHEAELETVVALALVAYDDPSVADHAAEVVPVVLYDGLMTAVTAGMEDAYMGCYPRGEGREHLRLSRQEAARREDALRAAVRAAAVATEHPQDGTATARAIIAAAQARTPPA